MKLLEGMASVGTMAHTIIRTHGVAQFETLLNEDKMGLMVKMRRQVCRLS